MRLERSLLATSGLTENLCKAIVWIQTALRLAPSLKLDTLFVDADRRLEFGWIFLGLALG